jgi:hypothetical protein
MKTGSRRLRALCVASAALWCVASPALLAQGRAALGRTVLALYKSSEGQSATDNEILRLVEPALRGLGLAVRYQDADAGVPDVAALGDCRAVVSWFRGPSMAQPERYLAFVREAIDSGRKFVVLDNLGAYQERSTGRWLEAGELNLTMSRFGLQYWGDWTDDPALVTVRSADAAVVRAEALAAAGNRLLFYRYIAMDRDLDVLLSVERRDRSYGPSPVIVANRNGAFVLSSYLLAYRSGGEEIYVDFAALMRRALFGRPKEERVAVLTDFAGKGVAGQGPAEQDPPAVSLAARVLRAGRIGADVYRAADLPLLVPGDLSRYTVVALALGAAAGVDDKVLASYLAQGGSVLCLSDVVPDSVRRIASAVPPAETPEAAAVSGLRFGSGFLTTEGYFLEDRDVSWTAGTLRPPKGAAVLASDWLDATPLLWSVSVPAGGTIVVWNARELWRPEHAGLMMESFLACRPVAACVTPGLAAIRIDGFPRPLYNVTQKAVGATDTEFYTTRFWPDLRDLLAKRGIPVSAAMLFTYNDRVSPPFWGGELYVADRQAAVEQAREVVASGAEVGLLGYNHVSLATSPSGPNTRGWASRGAMEEALRSVRAEWQMLFGAGAVPRSYAAPYGILSEDGLAALRAAFPEVHVAGVSLASGGVGAGGFVRSPLDGGVRIEPASSTGYFFTDQVRRLMTSGVLGDGVWVHAVDADDALDPSVTGGRKWDDLEAELDRTLAFAAKHYPWLRFVRVTDLARELDRNDEMQARFELAGTAGGVTTYVAEVTPGSLLRLRMPGLRVQGVKGGELVYAYARADAAVIRAQSRRVVVSLVRRS